MEITKTNITIKDLIENYSDDGDDGVWGYNNRLEIRPSYQRAFVYSDKQRDEVINTVIHNRPLNVMYWSKAGDDKYEILDGQQRTISICQYCNKDFSFNHRFIHNLTPEEKEAFLNYELDIYICEGTEAEKLEWFRVINIAGAVLTNQELLNATYTGPWLADAKKHFSKKTSSAFKMSDGYLKGNPIRQEVLEKVLLWIADRDNLVDGQEYMAIHQHDKDANDIWVYFQTVINWAKMLFPKTRKGITDSQNWGILYNKFKDKSYNINELEEDIKKYLLDDDVTNKKGIIEYLLSGKSPLYEKCLSIRVFTESQKLRAYEKQNHHCLSCLKKGIDTEYEYEEMQGDHIIPWSKGGHTTDDNLQMLCRQCNNDKSDS